MDNIRKSSRAAMKSKAQRIATASSGKVDSSTWTAPEPLNADVKTGLRPVSKRAYKRGGKVEGKKIAARADRKARKDGGKTYANDLVNRNVKDANESREGKKHIGGMKSGGRAHKDVGGGMPYGGGSDSGIPQGKGKAATRMLSIGMKKGGTAKRAKKAWGGPTLPAQAMANANSHAAFMPQAAAPAAPAAPTATTTPPVAAANLTPGGQAPNAQAIAHANPNAAFMRSTAPGAGNMGGGNAPMPPQAHKRGGKVVRKKRDDGGVVTNTAAKGNREYDRATMSALANEISKEESAARAAVPKPRPRPMPSEEETFDAINREGGDEAMERTARKHGGRTKKGKSKGKTNIHINIGAGSPQPQGIPPDVLAALASAAPAAGGPSPAAPGSSPKAPMPMPVPVPMPAAAGPQMPPGQPPMGRATGGRAYKMKAGAQSGLGRIQKADWYGKRS